MSGTSFSEHEVLETIDYLEDFHGFLKTNFKPKPPTFTEIWNKLITNKRVQGLNTSSQKTMTFRCLKKLVKEKVIEKIDKRYRLTPKGRTQLNSPNLNRNPDLQFAEVPGRNFIASFAFTPKNGPIIRERINEDVWRNTIQEIDKVVKEKNIPDGTTILIKVDKEKEEQEEKKS